MFDKIFEEAKKAAEINKQNYEKNIKEQEEYKTKTSPEQIIKDKEGKSWTTLNGKPFSCEVHSEELLDIINKLGFEVLEYNKRVDEISYDEYDPILEFYTVKNNKYKFIVKNMSDVDITDGIFGVYNVINLKTNEQINFYVDLSCRNTGKAKLKDFLMLISCDSMQEYINKKYEKCISLEEKLKNAGYEVAENTLEYFSERITGNILLENGIFIVPYNAWCDELRFVVTNYGRWGVNDSNSYNKIGYYVEYENDINVLINAIEALKVHLSGKYGYLENGVYYKNSDVEKFFNKFKDKDKHGKYRYAYNNHLIRIESPHEWDGRGYGDFSYISVLSGLEMAKHYNFEINNTQEYGLNNKINDSDILIKYNKKEDPKNCILMINNYQYNENDEYMNYEYDEDGDCLNCEYVDRLNENYNKEFLIDSVVFKGTFTECMKVLHDYIYKLLEIFEIDIEKRG